MKRLGSVLVLALLLIAFDSCTPEDPIEPDVDQREKFLGTWNVQEKIDGQVTGAYISVVSNDVSNTSRIRIGNIYNLGVSSAVNALVAGNSLNISTQAITGITITGTGLYSSNGFTLNYTASDGSSTSSVQAIYTK
jgi:hypothetical protein